MMTPSKPGSADAWHGDWKQRLYELVAQRGLTSAAAYAATHPTLTFVALAEELAPGRIAAVQIEWSLLEEAKAAGTMANCARDFFVRWLHQYLEHGWLTETEDDQRRVASAVAGWSSSIRSHLPEYKPTLATMRQALSAESPFPVDWLPTDANDPILVEFFKRHWVEPPRDR